MQIGAGNVVEHRSGDRVGAAQWLERGAEDGVQAGGGLQGEALHEP